MSAILRIAQDIASNLGTKIEYMINCLLSPKQRERALENIRTFFVHNPKLALFLAAQTALAGLPILLFITFATATLAVSLITCVLLGIFAAFVFTLLTTGFALVFVVPVVFIGSCSASIAFLWGLFGYLVLQRINGSETPAQPGTEVSNTLDELISRRTRGALDRSVADAQQERLAVGSSQCEKVLVGRKSECGDNKTRGCSPHQRHYGQTNGIRFDGEVGEESDESGTRGAEVGTRDYPEARKSGHDPTVKGVVEWGRDFQQKGLTT